jgi:hypothetical protein
MRTLLRVLALVAALVAFEAGDPALAAAEGCYENCVGPAEGPSTCQGGGHWFEWCVQGYQGSTPVCYEFIYPCGSGFAALTPSGERDVQLAMSDRDLPRCDRSAIARADAVSRFQTTDALRTIYYKVELETGRTLAALAPPAVSSE